METLTALHQKELIWFSVTLFQFYEMGYIWQLWAAFGNAFGNYVGGRAKPVRFLQINSSL